MQLKRSWRSLSMPGSGSTKELVVMDLGNLRNPEFQYVDLASRWVYSEIKGDTVLFIGINSKHGPEITRARQSEYSYLCYVELRPESLGSSSRTILLPRILYPCHP